MEDEARTARRTLTITSTVVFMISLEITIIALAFPKIQAAFPDTSESTLSWIITGYNIGVASLLLLAGWWADNFGPKKVFLLGLALFAVGSSLAASAWSAPILIAARIVQSFGGAIQYPAGLALLLSAVPSERRQEAIGIWGAMGALAAALGPSLGALLVEWLGWRSIFAVNVPVALVATVLGRRWLVENRVARSHASRRVDLLSVPLASIGVGSVLFGIVQAETLGVGSPAMIGAIGGGIGLISLFVLRSKRHPAPLFDLALFEIRSYRVANVAAVAFVMAFFSWLVTLPSFIQEEWGWSVIRTGFAIAPTPLLPVFLSPLLGRLADHIGVKPIVVLGGASGTVGAVLHRSLTESEPAYVSGILVPGLFIGIAAGCSFAMLTAGAMRDVPPHRFGMAGAGRTTIFQLGVASGVAMGFAITVGEGSGANALDRIHILWLVCAVLYFAQFLVFALFFPGGREAAIADGPTPPLTTDQ